MDASVVVELVLGTADASFIMDRLFDPRETLHAPHLMDVEVAQVIRRYGLRREIPAVRAHEAVGILRDLPIRRYAHQPLLTRMWELRESLTAYDAAYVALAEGLGATLITRDERLATAPAVDTKVEVI